MTHHIRFILNWKFKRQVFPGSAFSHSCSHEPSIFFHSCAACRYSSPLLWQNGRIRFICPECSRQFYRSHAPGHDHQWEHSRPHIAFTEGDTAVIRVHNLMDTETSFHWHGLLVPNDQDGVPYLTSAPVKPHTTHTYTFPSSRTARTGTIPTAVSGAERPVRSVHRPQTAR